MATFVLFDEFAENMSGAINLNTDVFKVALTNTLPVQDTADELVDITQIAAGFGYTTGGATLTTVTWAETAAGSGVWKFSSDDVTFTASGGAIAAHQYGVLYSDTSTNDKLVGFVDRGSSATITDGNSRTWDVGANGWFTLTVP
jgi:hypothetical protein